MKSFLTFAEALKGGQHKIDVDKDGKIEGEDLAKLRAMKKEEVEQIEEVEELDEDKYDRMLSSMLKGKSGERLLKKHSDEVKNKRH
jgi:tRNA uridine 5-carbamoylmethylation protein Kti12